MKCSLALCYNLPQSWVARKLLSLLGRWDVLVGGTRTPIDAARIPGKTTLPGQAPSDTPDSGYFTGVGSESPGSNGITPESSRPNSRSPEPSIATPGLHNSTCLSPRREAWSAEKPQ